MRDGFLPGTEIDGKEKVRAWVAAEDTGRLNEWGVLKQGEGPSLHIFWGFGQASRIPTW